MLNIFISFLTFILIIISLFMVLVILMQRGSANAGMGSAFGGGAAESAFGAETTNILTKATKWSAVTFFLLSLGLYLLYMARESAPAEGEEFDVPDIPVQTEENPAADAMMMEEAMDAAEENAVEGEEGQDSEAGAEQSAETPDPEESSAPEEESTPEETPAAPGQ